jgi:hypothetical protein
MKHNFKIVKTSTFCISKYRIGKESVGAFVTQPETLNRNFAELWNKAQLGAIDVPAYT